MNTPIGRAPSPPSADARRTDDAPGADSPEHYQAEAAFERVLRSKSASRERQDDRDDDDAAGDVAALLPMAPQPNATPAPLAAGPLVAVAAADAPPPLSLRASVEAAFGAPIPPAPVAGEQHTWDVSLREPQGVPVDLRAVRVPPPLPGAAAGAWSLTVSAGRDTQLLARHASRLHERLRARALDATHVRVQRDDDEESAE
jgi:hypothetical protein